ncbi:MAG: beta strand repeat-containing protein, partial [Chloroflexota bacterium]
SSGTGVALSNSASGTFTFDNLAVTSTAGVALNVSSVGTVNVDLDDNDFPILSATTRPVLDIDNAIIHMNLATLTSVSSTTHGVDLTNILSGSTLGVTNTTTVTSPTFEGVHIDAVGAGSSLIFGDLNVTNRGSHGIFIQDHTGTTVTFGDVNITNGLNVGGDGVHVQKSGGGSSTGGITFASLDISSTNATVNRADVGADGTPDNETDDGHGVRLMDHSGGLIVTGTGTQGDGGTIQNIEGDGFSLIRSGGLNLDKMTINNIGTSNQAATSVDNAGIYAYNLIGTNVIKNSTISRFQDGSVGGGRARGVSITNNGTSFTEFRSTDVTYFNDNSLLGDDGIQLVTNNAVSGALTVESAVNLGNGANRSEFYHLSGDGVQVIQNGSGSLTTSISDTTFRDAVTPGGFGGIDLSSAGSGIMSNTIDECLFLALYPGGVNNSGVITLFASGTVDYDATVNNSTFGSGSQRTSDGRGAIRASTDTDLAATVTDFDVTITNNTIDDTDREAISIYPRGGAVPIASGRAMDFVITGNNIGQTTAVANDGGIGREGIEIVATESAKLVTLLLQNNTIRNFVDSSSDETVDIDTDGSVTMNITVLGNTFSQSGSTTDSIDISTLNAAASVCLDMNSANTSANVAPGGITITESAGTFSIEDIGGAAISAATVKTFLEARNTGTATVTGTFDSCNSH